MPEGRGELELSLQPMIERPSFWLAFVLPNELGTHCDFILRCFRMSVGHMFLNGTGTTAMYCDILILREIFLGQNSSDVATFDGLGILSCHILTNFPQIARLVT